VRKFVIVSAPHFMTSIRHCATGTHSSACRGPLHYRNPCRLRSTHRCCLAPTSAEVTGSLRRIWDGKNNNLSLILLFEHKLDNNFGTEGVQP
jgi:hypothetical protein